MEMKHCLLIMAPNLILWKHLVMIEKKLGIFNYSQKKVDLFP
jgi:hypothetical protein